MLKEIAAYRNLQKEEDLLNMATLATFIAYQTRAKKMKSPAQLAGIVKRKRQTSQEMRSALARIHAKSVERNRKDN